MRPSSVTSATSLPADCPFCDPPTSRVAESNELAYATADAFPASPGHTLIIVRRHVPEPFDLTDQEVRCVFTLANAVRRRLDAAFRPNGYNLGFNVGAAAGQTVGHVHLHVIPRYAGDVVSPVGGIRNVIPGKGAYPISEPTQQSE